MFHDEQIDEQIGNHVTLRLHKLIAESVKERRALARCVLECARSFILLMFRVVHTHLHLEPAELDPRTNEMVRRIKIGWKRRYPRLPPLITLPTKPICSQGHLENTFTYQLDQEPHHNVWADPLHESSGLPDLLGLRVTGRHLIKKVKRKLPGVNRDLLLERLAPATPYHHFNSFADLADAAAAAVALPDLKGKGALQRAARGAAVALSRPHLSAREIGDLLKVGVRQVERIVTSFDRDPVDRHLVRAIELQLGLRSSIAALEERKSSEAQDWSPWRVM
jgi:hypothetical protein